MRRLTKYRTSGCLLYCVDSGYFMYPRGKDVKRHGEDQIDRQHEYPEEPRRSSAAGDERRGHRGDQYHHDGARSELPIHLSRVEDIAEQHQQRGDQQCDLGRSPQRDAHGLRSRRFLRTPENAEPISAGTADQRHDEEARRWGPCRTPALPAAPSRQTLAHQRHRQSDGSQHAHVAPAHII